MTVYRFPANLIERILFMPDGCVEFTGSRDKDGYGRLRVYGRVARAHRAVYELLVGPIPEGLELDHLCRNTSCVNPHHLEPVTTAENLHRAKIAQGLVARTHCKWGHELTDENTYKGRGYRDCLECRRISGRRSSETTPPRGESPGRR